MLTKIRFVRNAGLNSKIIIGLFLCKVLAGLASGRITQNMPNADTWSYHTDALKEYQLLFSRPGEYLINMFQSEYADGYNGMIVVHNSYWNDLKTNIIIKLLSVFDIFSAGNYYSNVVLYNFLFFFGSIGLFRVFKHVYPDRPILLLVCIFLLPSTLYFGSTIHKDGIIFAATGAVIFNIYHALNFTGFTVKRLIFILLSMLLIFLIRNFVFIALVPALAAMIIAAKKKYNPVIIFSIIYIISIIIFFNLRYILPSVDLPAYMAERQADFITLGPANTRITLNVLHPIFTSFAINAPQALLHSLCRPYLTDIHLSFLLLPLGMELICYQLLLVIFIFFRKEKIIINHPFILFGLFFGISVCLMIGYTVPVIGAIARYRSMYLPFLLIPFIYNIEWRKIVRILHFKK